MATMALTGVTRFKPSLSSYLPPLFLAPALAHASLVPSTSPAHRPSCSFPPCKVRPFSTTPSPQKRAARREKNKSRGVSAIRRTGPRVPLSIDKYELPRPFLDPPLRKRFKTNPNHGLWGFFNADKTAMSSPEEEYAHGRAWTYAELNYKSFDDLHRLYWVCMKERNRIATAKNERSRVHAGYGDYESQSRDDAVRETMDQIRQLLTDRYHSWQEAVAILNGTPLKDLPLDEEEGNEHFEEETPEEKSDEVEMKKFMDEKDREKEMQNASPAVIRT